MIRIFWRIIGIFKKWRWMKYHYPFFLSVVKRESMRYPIASGVRLPAKSAVINMISIKYLPNRIRTLKNTSISTPSNPKKFEAYKAKKITDNSMNAAERPAISKVSLMTNPCTFSIKGFCLASLFLSSNSCLYWESNISLSLSD